MKPRIKRIRGRNAPNRWVCYTEHSWGTIRGISDSPEKAYAMWKRRVEGARNMRYGA